MGNQTDLDFVIARNNARAKSLEKQKELEQYVNNLPQRVEQEEILELDAEEVPHQEEQFDNPFDIPIVIDVSYFPDPNGGGGGGQGQGGGSGQGQPQNGDGNEQNESPDSGQGQQPGEPQNPEQGNDSQNAPTSQELLDSLDALRNALSEELDGAGNIGGESDQAGQIGNAYDDSMEGSPVDVTINSRQETVDAGSERVSVKKKFRDALSRGF